MTKATAFLLSLLVSLTVLAAACMWVFPKTSPSPAEVGGQTHRFEDSFSLQVSLQSGESCVGATLRFEPAAERIRVVAGEAEADRRAVLTPEGLERMLAALGNNLPLTLSEPVQVCEHNRYLNLPAGAQLLAAEQVTTLLQLRPALFPAVVAAMLNTYDDPVALLTLLLGHSEDTDLSAKDGAAVRDRLVRLWESGHGRPAVTI